MTPKQLRDTADAMEAGPEVLVQVRKELRDKWGKGYPRSSFISFSTEFCYRIKPTPKQRPMNHAEWKAYAVEFGYVLDIHSDVLMSIRDVDEVSVTLRANESFSFGLADQGYTRPDGSPLTVEVE